VVLGKCRRDYSCRLVVVGDASTEKTAVLASYTSNQVPKNHVPAAFDNYPVNLRYGYHLLNPEEWEPGQVLCLLTP
jgi:GTPase SAR1 family protein